jgi:hypothetical protein
MYEVECRIQFNISPTIYNQFLKEYSEKVKCKPKERTIYYWDTYRYYDNKIEQKLVQKNFTKCLLVDGLFFKYVISNEIDIKTFTKAQQIELYKKFAFYRTCTTCFKRYYWEYSRGNYIVRINVNRNLYKNDYSFECEIEMLKVTIDDINDVHKIEIESSVHLQDFYDYILGDANIPLAFMKLASNRSGKFGSSVNIYKSVNKRIYESKIYRQRVLPLTALLKTENDRSKNHYAVKWNGVFGNVWLYFDNDTNQCKVDCFWEDGLIQHFTLKDKHASYNNCFCFSAERLKNGTKPQSIILLDLISVDLNRICISLKDYFPNIVKFLGSVVTRIALPEFSHQIYYESFLDCQRMYWKTRKVNDGILLLNYFSNLFLKIKMKYSVELLFVSFLCYKDILNYKRNRLLLFQQGDRMLRVNRRNLRLFIDKDYNVYTLIRQSNQTKLRVGYVYECILDYQDISKVSRVVKRRRDRFCPNTRSLIEENHAAQNMLARKKD